MRGADVSLLRPTLNSTCSCCTPPARNEFTPLHPLLQCLSQRAEIAAAHQVILIAIVFTRSLGKAEALISICASIIYPFSHLSISTEVVSQLTQLLIGCFAVWSVGQAKQAI